MKIKEATDQFIMDKGLENLSRATITTYKKVLRELNIEYGDEDIKIYNPEMVREFFLYLRNRENMNDGSKGLAQSTIELYYRVIHNFSKWCVTQRYIKDAPTDKVPKPKTEKLIPETISDENLGKLFRYLENQSNPRITSIFEFFLDTGCRVSEVVNLDIDDVHIDDGWAKIFGKGSREAIVPLGDDLCISLEYYSSYIRPDLVKKPDEKAFFLTRNGSRFTKSGLSMLVRRYLERVGVTGKIGPHKLRHTFATNYLRYGGDLESLRRILRHSSVVTTQKYIALLSEDLINAHRKASPLDNFRKRQS